jgi:thioredoxin-dependent peroxiredoxin
MSSGKLPLVVSETINILASERLSRTILKAGDKAPDFALPDHEGNIHTSNEFRGRWLIVYFYPKDFTEGCIAEACSFRDNYNKIRVKAEVVGISGDTVGTHSEFADEYTLPFILLADPKKKVIKKYSANGIIVAKRITFLIDADGVIRKIYEKVNPRS